MRSALYDSSQPPDVDSGSLASQMYRDDRFPTNIANDDELTRFSEMFRRETAPLTEEPAPSAALTPTPPPIPSLPTTGSEGAPEPSAAAAPAPERPLPSGGGKWIGEPVGYEREKPSAPEEAGVGTEILGGAARGGAAFAQQAGHVVGYVTKQLGRMTDSEAVTKVGESVDKFVDGLAEDAGSIVPARTMREAYNAGWGSFAKWSIGKAAEGGVGVLPILGMSKIIGLPGVLGYAAIAGAVEEARKPDSTLASIAAGAAESMAMMGAPVKLIQATATLGLAKRVAAQGAGFGALGGAGTVTHPIPRAVATGEYEAPTLEQAGEGAYVGGVTGAFLAPGFGAKAPPARTEPPPSAGGTPPPATEAPPAAPLGLPPPGPGNRPPIITPPPGAEGRPPPPSPSPPGGGGMLALPPPRPLTAPERASIARTELDTQVALDAAVGPKGATEVGPTSTVVDPAVRAATEVAMGGQPEGAPERPTGPLVNAPGWQGGDLAGIRERQAAADLARQVPPGGEPPPPPPPPGGPPGGEIAPGGRRAVADIAPTTMTAEQAAAQARSAVAPEATPVVSVTEAAPGTTASVRLMMTNEMRSQLRDLGYTRGAIREMTPDQAGRFIDAGTRAGAAEPAMATTGNVIAEAAPTLAGAAPRYPPAGSVERSRVAVERLRRIEEGAAARDAAAAETAPVEPATVRPTEAAAPFDRQTARTELLKSGSSRADIRGKTDEQLREMLAAKPATAGAASIEAGVAPPTEPLPTAAPAGRVKPIRGEPPAATQAREKSVARKPPKPTPTPVVEPAPPSRPRPASLPTKFGEVPLRRLGEERQRAALSPEDRAALANHDAAQQRLRDARRELSEAKKGGDELQVDRATNKVERMGRILKVAASDAMGAQRRLEESRAREAPPLPTATREAIRTSKAQPAKRPSEMADSIAEDARTGVSVGAHEQLGGRLQSTVRGTPIEAVAEGETARPTPVAQDIGEARSKKVTDANLKYSDQLHSILKEGKPLADAVRDAGSKAPGTRGRPRRNPVFENYLDEVIKRAEKNDAEDRQIMVEGAKIQERTDLSLTQKKKLLTELSEEQQSLVAVRGERAELERERLADLKRLRRGEDINEPELNVLKSQSRQQRRQEERRRVVDPETVEWEARYDAAWQQTLKTLQEPLNKRLQDRVDTHKVDDIHDYLRDIIDDPAVKLASPHYVEAAKRLLEILPNTPAGSFESLKPYFNSKAHDILDQLDSDAAGAFIRQHGLGEDVVGFTSEHVTAPDRVTGPVETVIHESLHRAASDYMTNIREKYERGEKLTSQEIRHTLALDAIRDEMFRVLESGDPLHALEREKIELALGKDGSTDAQEEQQELLTYMLSSPMVMGVTARTRASPEFRAAMKDLGYGRVATVWQGFKRLLGDIFGFKNDSILNHILDPMLDIVEAGGKHLESMKIPPEFLAVDYGKSDRTEEHAARTFTALRAERGRRADELPTEKLPNEQARETMRPFAQAVKDYFSRKNIETHGAGIGTAAARAGLKTAGVSSTTDQLTRFNADLVPAGLQTRDAMARTRRVAAEFYNEWGDRVQNWARQLHYGRDVGKLMNDATLNRTHLGNDITDFAARNAHLTGDEMKRADELRERFNNLTPEKQQLYQEVRDYYRRSHEQERELTFQDIVRRSLPEATKKQIEVLGEKVRTQRGTREILADDSPLAEAFGERWENSRALVREIIKERQAGFIRGDYFPLRRYGNYVIRVDEPGGEHFAVEMFETSTKAKNRLAELRADKDLAGVNISEVLSKAAHPSRKEFIPDSALYDVERALVQRGASKEQIEEVKDAFAQAMLKRAVGSAQAESRMRRNYVEGASDNAAQNLWGNYFSTGARIGHLTHGAAEAEGYRQMRLQTHAIEQASGNRATPAEIARSKAQLTALEARPGVSAADLAHARQQHAWLEKPPTGSQTLRAREFMTEMEARRAPMDGDLSADWLGKAVGKFTKASFIYHLARPAHLALQVADAHSNAYAALGAEYGYGKAGMAMAKAMRDLAPSGANTGFRNMFKAFMGEMKHSDWLMSQTLRDRLTNTGSNAEHMKLLEDRAADYGMIDHTFSREQQRMSRPGAFDFSNPTGRKGWTNLPSNMMNLFAAGEHAVDATNRMVILKAGFDLAMARNKGDVRQSVEDAVRFASDAMPIYGSWNTPRIATARGPIKGEFMPAAMQYKLYGLHMYSWMGGLVRQAMFRPEERAVAIKTLAGLVATHSVLAGVTANMFGLPVVAALGAWDLFQGKEKPHNYETDLRQWVTEVAGETAGTFASGGLLGLAGVQQQRSLKLTNMTDVPELPSFDKAGAGRFMIQGITGASGDVASQIFEGLHDLTTGNYWRGAKSLLPRVLGDPFKAYALGQEGVVDRRGRTIAGPETIGLGSQLAQATGFNPSATAIPRQRRAAEQELEDEVQYARRKAVDRYVASKGQDMSGVRSYLENERYRRMSPISIQQLREAMKEERYRQSHPQFYGMRPPKRAQQEYLAETRFN